MSKTNNGADLGFENKSWAATCMQLNFKKEGCMHV